MVSAAVNQSKRKANMVAKGYGNSAMKAEPRIPQTKKPNNFHIKLEEQYNDNKIMNNLCD